MRIRWTSKALDNLYAAINIIAPVSSANARQVALKIRDSIALLATQPGMGRPGRVEGTRELVIPGLPFIVPYAELKGEIVILRSMHSSRIWPESLSTEKPGISFIEYVQVSLLACG